MLDPNVCQQPSWWAQWPNIVLAAAAIVQAGTAIIIVLLTRRLVRVTQAYATLTKSAVDISDKQYQLSTKQYEDEASPMWHLSLSVLDSPDNQLWLKLHNLSKNSAIVSYLFVRAESEGDQESQKFVLDIGLPALQSDSRNIREQVLRAVEQHLENKEWSGIIEVSVVFTLGASDAQLVSPPSRFKIAIRNGRVTSVQRRLQSVSVESLKDAQQ
jgi:hypothetical protein